MLKVALFNYRPPHGGLAKLPPLAEASREHSIVSPVLQTNEKLPYVDFLNWDTIRVLASFKFASIYTDKERPHKNKADAKSAICGILHLLHR